jgi:hypothetical protein
MEEFSERDKDIHTLAALEIVRVHQAKPFSKAEKKSSDNDTTAQLLEIDLRGEQRIFSITSMSAVDKTTASKMIRLGIWDGASYHYFTARNTGTNKESVDYAGQILAGEGSKAVARFEGVGATDELEFEINGYWIRE